MPLVPQNCLSSLGLIGLIIGCMLRTRADVDEKLGTLRLGMLRRFRYISDIESGRSYNFESSVSFYFRCLYLNLPFLLL